MAGIRIELELEDGTFTSRMLHAGESVAQFNRNVGQLVTGVGAVQDGTLKFMTVMRDMTVMLGLARDAFETLRQVTVGWAYDIVKVNAEMERMTTLLTGMSKAVDPMKEAADQVKFLRDYSKEAPFSLKALSDTFVKMKATGIDPMNGALKATVDAVSAIGGNEETLKRVGIALTQMSGKGVIQMEELRQQLGEAIPRAVELMARSVGVGMGELIAQVGKGTVEAKSTLNAFMLELDRTFGGSAQAQMRTFNGMVSQMTTLFQTLALEAGDAGFFEIVKKQLADFNTLLGTNTAKVLAETLGNGLTRVVLGLRDLVDWLVTARNELFRVGEILAIAFGAKIAISGLQLLTHSIQGVVLELRTFGVAWTAMQTTMQLNSIGVALGQLGIAGLGISRTTGALVAMRAVLGTLAVGISTIAGVVVPLGIAIAGVAYYFGLFSNKAEDAYQSLVKYGAESRKQVAEAQESLPKLEKRLAESIRIRDLQLKATQGYLPDDQQEQYKNNLNSTKGIDKDQDELDRRKRVLAQADIDATKKEAETAARARLQGVSDQLADIRKSYDQEANIRGTAHDKEIEQLRAAHKDIQKEKDAFQTGQRAAALKYYDDQLAILDNAMEAEKTRRQLGDEDALKIADKFDADMERQRRLVAETRRAQAEAPIGIQTLANKDNLPHALEKATQEINRLKGEIEGSKASLAGFSGEWEKLIYSLTQAAPTSKSGPLDNAQLQESIELIKKLKAEQEAYQQQVDSANKIDRELERLKSAAQLKILENATRGKNELDKFATAMEMGLYSGQKPITLMERGFVGIRDAAKLAGDTMKTTFGGEVLTAGESLLSVVKNIGAAFVTIGKKPGGAGGKNTLAGLYDQGGNPNTGSFEQRLIHSESGGDNNAQARNSSALGAGQFIKSTWLEFLREVHPKTLETMSETAALDLRRDGGMNHEAVQWYKQKNSTAFGMHNIESNDANLQLGHFLGTGGAIAALSKSSETLVTMIPELASAIKANPDVFKSIGTVGDLRKWAQGRVGTGTTTGAPYQANDKNDPVMPIPRGLTNAQAAMFDETRKLEQQGNAGANDNKLTDKLDEMKRKILELREAGDGTTKVFAAMRKMIEKGDLGPDKDPDSKRYTELLKQTKIVDKEEEAYSERKKARTQQEAAVASAAREKEVLADRDAEIKRRFESETTFKFSQEIFRRDSETKKRNQETEKGVALGVIPKATGDAQIAESNATNQHYKNLEVESYIQAEQEKTKVLQRNLMTQDDARKAAEEDDLARMRSALSQYEGDLATRAMMDKVYQDKKRALEANAFVNSPIGKELKDWSDLSNNLQKDVAGWMTASIDKLSNLILFGKRNWRDFMNQVISDLAKAGMKAAAGSVLSSLLGAAGLPTGGGGSKFTNAAQHHMGGIAGSLPLSRQVDASLFTNARRYHEGGIVAGEVPIIAKKGEEVGWPAQLAAKYGGNQVNQVNHINVQGSAGTPDQNQDLATRIVKSINDGLDARMDSRMAAQMRSGGLFGK